MEQGKNQDFGGNPGSEYHPGTGIRGYRKILIFFRFTAPEPEKY